MVGGGVVWCGLGLVGWFVNVGGGSCEGGEIIYEIIDSYIKMFILIDVAFITS